MTVPAERERFIHVTGTTGIDYVRIFERTPGGSLYFTQTGQESPRVLRIGGIGVCDREIAIQYAEAISHEMRLRHRERQASALLVAATEASVDRARTVREILDALHADRDVLNGWTGEKYRRDQAQMQRFWLEIARWGDAMEHVGWGGRPASEVTPAEVQRAVWYEVARREALQEGREEQLVRYEAAETARQEAWAARERAKEGGEPLPPLPPLPPKVAAPTSGRQIRPWAASRTRNKPRRYLKDAFEYARVHLKWLTEAETLSGLRMEKPRQGGSAYAEAELHRLAKVVDFIDLRLAVAFFIAWDTGRRVGAIRQLRTADIREVPPEPGCEGPVMMAIRFDREFDKPRADGEAVVTQATARLIRVLMGTRVVRETGILFPNRSNLSSLRPGHGELAVIQPFSSTTADDLLGEAERMAEVPHVPGRLWHGIKRRTVTRQRKVAGDWAPVSRQSGTDPRTLIGIYNQVDLEDQLALAAALEGERPGVEVP
jgi:integrase